MNELALDLYMKILATMALIFFIVNQFLILYRGIHEDWIVHKVRKKIRSRRSGQVPPKAPPKPPARDVKPKTEFHMPEIKLNMKAIWIGIGIFVLLLVLMAFSYIAFFYNPSPLK